MIGRKRVPKVLPRPNCVKHQQWTLTGSDKIHVPLKHYLFDKASLVYFLFCFKIIYDTLDPFKLGRFVAEVLGCTRLQCR